MNTGIETNTGGPFPGAPDFMIIGAMKAGTTSLYQYLASHPSVFISPVKEPHYFYHQAKERGIDLGPTWHPPNRNDVTHPQQYERLFSDAGGRLTCEASVSSLCFEGCARVIDETGSDVKLIAVLRDPVSRLISAHTFFSQWPELEPLGLEAAIKDEPRRIRDSECRICWHVDLGFYARQLAPYVQRFGDRLKIVLFDDLRQDTQGTVADVCRFLGIDDEVDLDVGGTYNRGGRLVHPRLHRLIRRDSGVRRIVQAVMPLGLRRRIRSRLDEFVRTSVVLDKAIRNELRERFLQDIGRLEVMIARDLSAWKKKD